MKQINPLFQHEMDLDKLEDNFLNDFVGLYRQFFHEYEEMFNFKLKLQNLIRPTNVCSLPFSTISSPIWSATSSTSAGTIISRPASGTSSPSPNPSPQKKQMPRTRRPNSKKRKKLSFLKERGEPVSMKQWFLVKNLS
jgi:hypothetical protein